jgi:hypothetical protein
MEFVAGARVAARPPVVAGFLPARNRRVGAGAIGIGYSRRAAARPKLSLPPAVARRAVAAAAGGDHLLPRRVVVRSAGGGDGGLRPEDAEGDRPFTARASPPDAVEGAAATER